MNNLSLDYQTPVARLDVARMPLKQGTCGDFMVTFGAELMPRARGGAASGWRAAAQNGEWRALLSSGIEGWKGYPCEAFETPAGSAWLIGELYGAGADRAAGRLSLIEGVTSGRTGAHELNGHFLLFFWDEAGQRWHVWTDRFGTLHAYHAERGGCAALGTFFEAVTSASRRTLDWVGVSGFFAQGFFPSDRTYYEDVKILKPATHYVFDESGRLLSHSRYWQWPHKPVSGIRYVDTVAEFASVFEQVMGEQTGGGRIALPVSGGLDSRTTVAACGRGDGNLWAYSYGYTEDSVETRIARRIARARSLPFDSFTVGQYLFDRLGMVQDCVEGFQDVTQCRQAAVVEGIDTHADYIIAAHWGDVWHDTTGLDAERDGAASEDEVAAHTYKKMVKKGSAWLLRNLCDGIMGAEVAERLLHESVQKGLAEVSGVECADFRVKAFKTDNWSFRWTMTSLRMFQPGAFPRLPFYDTRVTDFFCRVPSGYVRDRALQIDYLKRFAPDLARITWQTYDASLYSYKYFNSLLLPKRALKKVARVLRQKKAPERNWEVQFMNTSGRRSLERHLLRPGLRLHEFVRPGAVRSLLDSFYASPLEQGRGYTVCMLLTFSSWLERNA
jgi:hypothetical protein